MGPKKFFKKVGRGVQSTIGEASKSFGKGAGAVLGATAANYALEAAPLLLMKTGGYVPGSRNIARKAILHGGETVLPYGVKPTKQQRDAIDKNLKLKRLGKFY